MSNQIKVSDFYSYIKKSLGDCSQSVIASLIMCNRETLGRNMDQNIEDWKSKDFGERLKRLFFAVHFIRHFYPEISPKELSKAIRIPISEIEGIEKPMSPVVLINTSLDDTEVYEQLLKVCFYSAKKQTNLNSEMKKVKFMIEEYFPKLSPKVEEQVAMF